MKRPFTQAGWGRALFYLVQFTWGLPVNVAGLLAAFACRGCRRERYVNSLVTFLPGSRGGLSLGVFLFLSAPKEDVPPLLAHEYGHTLQCLLLGPLYWVAVAAPSALWFHFFGPLRKRRRIPYDALYCERWATAWGSRWGRPKP